MGLSKEQRIKESLKERKSYKKNKNKGNNYVLSVGILNIQENAYVKYVERRDMRQKIVQN